MRDAAKTLLIPLVFALVLVALNYVLVAPVWSRCGVDTPELLRVSPDECGARLFASVIGAGVCALIAAGE